MSARHSRLQTRPDGDPTDVRQSRSPTPKGSLRTRNRSPVIRASRSPSPALEDVPDRSIQGTPEQFAPIHRLGALGASPSPPPTRPLPAPPTSVPIVPRSPPQGSSYALPSPPQLRHEQFGHAHRQPIDHDMLPAPLSTGRRARPSLLPHNSSPPSIQSDRQPFSAPPQTLEFPWGPAPETLRQLPPQSVPLPSTVSPPSSTSRSGPRPWDNEDLEAVPDDVPIGLFAEALSGIADSPTLSRRRSDPYFQPFTQAPIPAPAAPPSTVLVSPPTPIGPWKYNGPGSEFYAASHREPDHPTRPPAAPRVSSASQVPLAEATAGLSLHGPQSPTGAAYARRAPRNNPAYAVFNGDSDNDDDDELPNYEQSQREMAAKSRSEAQIRAAELESRWARTGSDFGGQRAYGAAQGSGQGYFQGGGYGATGYGGGTWSR